MRRDRWTFGCWLCGRTRRWPSPVIATCPGDVWAELSAAFPRLSKRTGLTLARHGIDVAALQAQTTDDLLTVCLIGPKTVAEIREAMDGPPSPYRGACS